MLSRPLRNPLSYVGSIEMPWESTPRRSVSTITSAVVVAWGSDMPSCETRRRAGGGCVARELASGPSRGRRPAHVDDVAVDAHLVDGNVLRDRPAQQPTGPHVEPGEVQGALHHVTLEPAPGQRRPLMAAGVPESVE